MNKEVEDIEKLNAVIKEEHDFNTFNDEFDDFINYPMSDDEQLEGLDEEELTGIEDAIDNIVDSADQNIYHNVENLNFSADLNLVKHFLNLEEIKIINVCKDVKLKKLLILNRAKHIQLQNIRYKIYELLKECKMSLKVLENEMEQCNRRGIQPIRSILPKLGHPYFKTKDFFACAPNPDTLRKQKNQEICIDYLPQICRWTIEDQVLLKRAIGSNYIMVLTEKYKSQLKTLEITKKISLDENVLESTEASILDIQEKLTELEQNSSQELPPLDKSDMINWIDISKTDLASRHAPEACKAFWNIYLHPCINKTNWTGPENKQILELAAKYNFQNWESIAADLQNNRSGFAVCVHYNTTLNHKIKKQKFNAEEDQFLVEVIEAFRIESYIPWTKVSHYFQNRSRAQLYHRYRYNLKYEYMKKGSFSQAEDVLIVLLIRKFGKDFSRCSTYMPHRTPPQIGHRYTNYLSFDKLSSGGWTLEDDITIMNHVKEYGEKKWSTPLSVLKMKNRNHIRNRYLRLKSWLLEHEDKSLNDIPRKIRSRTKIDRNRAVKSTVEHFSLLNEIPSLYDINEHLRQLAQSPLGLPTYVPYRIPNDNIDKELVEYFQSTCKIKTSKIIVGQELNHIVDVVKTLMEVLEVEITVPSYELLQHNQNLDILDVEILSLLFSDISKEATNKSLLPSTVKPNYCVTVQAPNCDDEKQIVKFFTPNPITFLPPNINTLVGIRSLLLRHKSYKTKLSAKKQTAEVRSVVSQTSSSKPEMIDVDESDLNLTYRDKYIKRFNMIFKWPALMSIMEPKESLFVHKNAKKPCSETKEPPKIGRPKKNLIKVQLMNQARMKSYAYKKMLNQPSCSQNIQKLANENGQHPCFIVDSKSSSDMQDLNTPQIAEIDSKSFPTVKSKTNNKLKRSNNFDIETVDLKRIKTECIDHKNEFSELREDINKLNSVLMLELNKK